jgi:hypothetical protein
MTLPKYNTPADTDLVEIIKNLQSRLARIENYTGAQSSLVTIPYKIVPHYVAVSGSSSNLTTTASIVDIPGMTQSVPVGSASDRFMVTVTLDCQLTIVGAAMIGRLNVDGADETGQVQYNSNDVNQRIDVTQQWLVTGLTPGNVTFKVTATASSGAYIIRTGHSWMKVERVPLPHYHVTASGSFASMFQFPCVFVAHVPIVRFTAICSDGSTAGEFQLADNNGVALTGLDGVAVAPTPIPAGTTVETLFENNQDPNYWQDLPVGTDQAIRLQVRRTAGSGTIAINARYLIQVPS